MPSFVITRRQMPLLLVGFLVKKPLVEAACLIEAATLSNEWVGCVFGRNFPGEALQPVVVVLRGN